MSDRRIEAAAHVISRLRAEESGGCFNPSDDPQGECADHDCYCTRWCRSAAQAAIAAALAQAERDGMERGIRIGANLNVGDSISDASRAEAGKEEGC